MVLKSYFDGGNQADSSQYDRISLATVCGTANQWKRFEIAWRKVLYKHKAEFLHTSDAVSLNNEFSKDKGWNKTLVDAFIGDCVKTIGKHIEIPAGTPRKRARAGLYPFTLTVPLEDWKRARKVNSKLPTAVPEVCTTESLGFCFKRGRAIGAKFYQLYFDQGEPFFGHAHDRMRNPKSKKYILSLKQVTHIGESDMRLVPALQMADLFAWCINHNDRVTRQWHRELHGLPWKALLLDYDRLLKPIPGALERIATWKLPRRKPTE
jgi:hypothetical protein